MSKKESIILRRLTNEELKKVHGKKFNVVLMDNSDNDNDYVHDRYKIENRDELDDETIDKLKKEGLTEDGEYIMIGMFYSKIIVRALARDTFSVNAKYVHSETRDFKFDTVKKDFIELLSPSFEYRYKNDLNKYLDESKIKTAGIAIYLYAWTNPVLKQLGFNQVDDFANSIKEKVKSDKSYYETIREDCLKEISILPILERKKYIDRFIELGILNEKDKVDLEYYVDFSISKIKELLDNGTISRDELVTIVAQIYYFDRNPDELYPKENKKKNKYSSRVVSAMNLLEPIEILDMYLNGGLKDEEFCRTKIRKEDILATCKVGIVCYLLEKNDKVPERLKLTSKDLINLYGKTIGGDIALPSEKSEDVDLENEEEENDEDGILLEGNTFGDSTMDHLIRCGFIEPEDVIDIYEINKVLVHTDFDKDELYDDYEVIAYYTPRVLLNMALKEKLTLDFVEKYREMLDFENNKEVFRKKSLMLVDGIRDIVEKKANEDSEKDNSEEDIQRFILYFFNMGLCDLQTTKENVSTEFIQYAFMNDELSIEDIFSLYKKGLIEDKLIAEFYSDEELLDLYESGKINRDCLKALRKKDLLIDYFSDGKGQIEDFIDLYLKSDIISINDLNDVCELGDVDSSKISNLIDENVPYEKIKELFSNLLIDYSTIQILHSQEIITDEQFEEIKNALSTREFFKEIKKGRTFTVLTLREGNTVVPDKRPRPRPKPRAKEEEDFSDEMELISEILGKDVEEEVENDEIAMIESYNLNDRPTSLNNYRIFGNESLDGIVILQKAKKENAVFVMSALQLMYFLKENSTGEIKDRMRDKAYLKTIVGVECIEHTKHFARNLIEAASRVSPKVNQQLRGSDGKYNTDVKRMIDYMREKYLEEKSK